MGKIKLTMPTIQSYQIIHLWISKHQKIYSLQANRSVIQILDKWYCIITS
jgi:hypothetical protein